MIECLFLSGARVDELVHIEIEDLHLDAEPPRIYLRHCKNESNRYVPVLPTLTQELRTHLNGRRHGYLFETNPNDRYSARTMQSIMKSQAREAGIEKRVYPHLLRHSIATILLDSGEASIDQVHTFSCLSILRNAVVAWNTIQIGRIVSELRAKGQQIEAETLSHVHPASSQAHQPVRTILLRLKSHAAGSGRRSRQPSTEVRVRPKGADHQRGKDPPRQLLVRSW